MKNTYLQDVQFDLIRYANCWEDADVLLSGLHVQPESIVGSIASAGDNSFALLSCNPRQVIAVDLSHEQLFLTELKKIAIKNLDRNSFLAFIGVEPCANRLEIYYSFSDQLSANAKKYWDSRLSGINKGIIYDGKFEKYFHLFRTSILPLIHRKKYVIRLLEKKSPDEQKQFYNSTWNSWRWRLLFKIFFSKFMMGRFGRDPEFLRHVDIHVGNFVFQKAEAHLSAAHCQQNYFLHMIMLGYFGARLPFYLREEHYNRIQENIDKLTIRHGYIEDAFTPGEKFDYLNLSNIFEYMSATQFSEIAVKIHGAMRTNGRIAYWNLMALRKLSEILPAQFEAVAASENLQVPDNGFFYRSFICETTR